ncbi:MAG: thiamine pyrophosphate-dependent enzyme [Nocardioidaceae bacterium]
MMGLGELTTAVRERLPMLIVVANDSAYGMEHHNLRGAGLDPEHAKLVWPEFAEVARGYGAVAHTVTDLDQLGIILKGLDERPDGPVVIDLKIDAETVAGE